MRAKLKIRCYWMNRLFKSILRAERSKLSATREWSEQRGEESGEESEDVGMLHCTVRRGETLWHRSRSVTLNPVNSRAGGLTQTRKIRTKQSVLKYAKQTALHTVKRKGKRAYLPPEFLSITSQPSFVYKRCLLKGVKLAVPHTLNLGEWITSKKAYRLIPEADYYKAEAELNPTSLGTAT